MNAIEVFIPSRIMVLICNDDSTEKKEGGNGRENPMNCLNRTVVVRHPVEEGCWQKEPENGRRGNDNVPVEVLGGGGIRDSSSSREIRVDPINEQKWNDNETDESESGNPSKSFGVHSK